MLEFLLCICCVVWLFGRLPSGEQDKLKEKADEAKGLFK